MRIPEKSDAGQLLTLDFMIGATIFAFAVVLTLSFVAGTIAPFTANSDETILTSERVSDTLYSNRFASGDASSGVLDAARVDSYFDKTIDEMKSDLGIPEEYGFNITISDRDGNVIKNWIKGPSPPDAGSLSTSNRIGYIRGSGVNETAIVEIKVWSS